MGLQLRIACTLQQIGSLLRIEPGGRAVGVCHTAGVRLSVLLSLLSSLMWYRGTMAQDYTVLSTTDPSIHDGMMAQHTSVSP